VPFHIPIKIGLITDKGPLPISDDNNNSLLIELTKKQETITFENINKCPTPSLLQGFTAPVKLDFSYSEKDLILLMSEDLDDLVLGMHVSSWLFLL
jgi:aminopeptidase N